MSGPSSKPAGATGLGEAGDGTRRSFLRGAGTAAIASGAVLGTAAVARAQSARRRHGRPELFPGQNAKLFDEILSDEAGHVEILQRLLADPDNHLAVPVRAMPTLRNLEQPSYLAFLENAAGFENTGSGVYAGALIAIEQKPEYFPTAAGITTVESRHASFINALLNDALVPDFVPVEAPIDQTVTLSRVTPFIAKLNGSTPSFDPTTASPDNNFAILDFLLLLEYIETAFYRVNVGKFFG